MRATLLAVFAAFSFPTLACAQRLAPISHTADGHPDLQGVWTTRILTPLERAPGVASLSVSTEEATAMAKQILAKRAAPSELDPLVSDPDAKELARVHGEWRTSIVTAPADGQVPWTEEGKKLLAAQRIAQSGFDGPEQRSATERCILGSGGAPFMQ